MNTSARQLQVFLALVLIVTFFSITNAQQVYSASEAGKHIGDSATVSGKVYKVFTSRKGMKFLEIGADYPNNPFATVIFQKDTSLFADVQQYEGKTVAITGKITDYNGAAQIVLSSQDQIKIQNTDSEKSSEK